MPRSEVERKAIKNIRRWREKPLEFVREQFGVEPDPWQAQALEIFPTSPRLALKACKGPGKTAVLGWLGWNFLATRPSPKIAATSITEDNLTDCLWTEMSKWQKKSPWLSAAFAWTKTRIVSREHPETWWMSARTWSRSADPEQQADTLAGLHADYILFLIDESGSIPRSVMAAAEAAMATGIEVHLVQAGNPTMLEGPLHEACTTARHLWTVIEITGDPDDPNRSTRISIEWAREQIALYGRDNPWVMVNVLGKFPPMSLNALLGPDDCSAAMSRFIREDEYSFAAKILGVDVAREGDDRFVVFPRQGRVAFRPRVARNLKTQDQVALVAQCADTWGTDGILVDNTGGWGGGLIDGLELAGYRVLPVQFSGEPFDKRYLNKRAEMSFEAAEWVKSGGCLPNMPEFQREACAITYTFQKDKFMLPEKKLFKKLLGYSPDLWDGFICTFAYPVQPKAAHRQTMAETAFDPRQTCRPGPTQQIAEGAGAARFRFPG